jgi:hypothetical protein
MGKALPLVVAMYANLNKPIIIAAQTNGWGKSSFLYWSTNITAAVRETERRHHHHHHHRVEHLAFSSPSALIDLAAR